MTLSVCSHAKSAYLRKTGQPKQWLTWSFLVEHRGDRYWEENDDLHAEWHGEPPVSMLGPVIGSHSGPGAIAVAFFENK